MMTGCNSLTIYDIPANLKTPCDDLREINGATGKDILPVMIDDRIKYGACARKHEAIVKIINESSK